MLEQQQCFNEMTLKCCVVVDRLWLLIIALWVLISHAVKICHYSFDSLHYALWNISHA